MVICITMSVFCFLTPNTVEPFSMRRKGPHALIYNISQHRVKFHQNISNSFVVIPLKEELTDMKRHIHLASMPLTKVYTN